MKPRGISTAANPLLPLFSSLSLLGVLDDGSAATNAEGDDTAASPPLGTEDTDTELAVVTRTTGSVEAFGSSR